MSENMFDCFNYVQSANTTTWKVGGVEYELDWQEYSSDYCYGQVYQLEPIFYQDEHCLLVTETHKAF